MLNWKTSVLLLYLLLLLFKKTTNKTKQYYKSKKAFLQSLYCFQSSTNIFDVYLYVHLCKCELYNKKSTTKFLAT